MSSAVRRALGRYVPEHFHDPVGLATRLLRNGHPAARAAMVQAALGLAITPLDQLLEPRERARRAAAPPPSKPILLVCGPPRSGTTVLALALIQVLPVAYFTNLMALFPRSPLTARAWFGGRAGEAPPTTGLESYYGRTAGLSGVNDGLPFWDRWLGTDRTRPPTTLLPDAASDLLGFFGGLEQLTGRPLVAKNNSLNAAAALVGAVLPTARFVCLTRDPVRLAYSLYRARLEIHGTSDRPYGIPPVADSADPLESVCLQVLTHRRAAEAQQERLGPERFRFVAYEDFCRDPATTLGTLAAELLGLPPGPALSAISDRLRRTEVAPADAELYRRLEQTYARLASLPVAEPA